MSVKFQELPIKVGDRFDPQKVSATLARHLQASRGSQNLPQVKALVAVPVHPPPDAQLTADEEWVEVEFAEYPTGLKPAKEDHMSLWRNVTMIVRLVWAMMLLLLLCASCFAALLSFSGMIASLIAPLPFSPWLTTKHLFWLWIISWMTAVTSVLLILFFGDPGILSRPANPQPNVYPFPTSRADRI